MHLHKVLWARLQQFVAERRTVGRPRRRSYTPTSGLDVDNYYNNQSKSIIRRAATPLAEPSSEIHLRIRHSLRGKLSLELRGAAGEAGGRSLLLVSVAAADPQGTNARSLPTFTSNIYAVPESCTFCRTAGRTRRVNEYRDACSLSAQLNLLLQGERRNLNNWLQEE